MLFNHTRRFRSGGRYSRESTRRLAIYGLDRAAGGFSAQVRTSPEGWSGAPGWFRASASLGPVFSAFGLYLGSRPDLLGWRQAQQLARLPDRGPALPMLRVADALSDLASGIEAEREPSRVFLDRQLHAARGVDGRQAVVCLVPPGLEEQFAVEGERLEIWRRLFSPELQAAFDVALEDFRVSFARGLDLEQEFMVSSAASAAQVPGFVVPRLLHHGDGLGMLEDLGSTDLASLQMRGRIEPCVALELARCWLDLALSGPGFPERPSLDRTGLLADGRLTFGPGPWGQMSEAARQDFETYLLALLAGQVETAFEALRSRLPSLTSDAEEALWRRFRQVAPQRDGGWDLIGARLADRVILDWRLLTDQGYTPADGSMAFLRGLVELEVSLRRLAPGQDVLAECMAERRWLASARRWRQIADSDSVRDGLRRSWSLGLEIPAKMEKVLRQARDRELAVKVRYRESPVERRGKDRQTLVIALAVAVIAFTLAGSGWDSMSGDSIWQRGWTLLHLGLGGTLLWLVRGKGSVGRPAPPRLGDER